MVKVLVVDDDPIARELAAQLIELDGHQVSQVDCGEAAIKFVQESDIQIMILDIRMPGIDGLEVCRQLRSDVKTSSIYVIMLSAKDKLGERIEGLDVGADAYLTKPYDVEELKAQIRVAERTAIDRHLSMHDALTGLFNRRAFDELLLRELASCSRYGDTLSLVTIDLDHFKVVNDTYGHEAGDIVLQELANLIRKISRPSDLPCRWGGEEFSWLLPKTDIKGAIQAAERLRREIEMHDFPRIGTQTASMGVAEIQPQENGVDLCKRADLALYEAKATGRNKVVQFNDTMEPGNSLKMDALDN
jgi:two-component system cell cycle response regulator